MRRLPYVFKATPLGYRVVIETRERRRQGRQKSQFTLYSEAERLMHIDYVRTANTPTGARTYFLTPEHTRISGDSIRLTVDRERLDAGERQ